MNVMAYRAGILGGKLAVEPVSGGGTRIVCRLPRKPGNPGQSPCADGFRNEPASPPAPQEDRPHAR